MSSVHNNTKTFPQSNDGHEAIAFGLGFGCVILVLFVVAMVVLVMRQWRKKATPPSCDLRRDTHETTEVDHRQRDSFPFWRGTISRPEWMFGKNTDVGKVNTPGYDLYDRPSPVPRPVEENRPVYSRFYHQPPAGNDISRYSSPTTEPRVDGCPARVPAAVGDNAIYDRPPGVPLAVGENPIYDRPPDVLLPVEENLIYDRPPNVPMAVEKNPIYDRPPEVPMAVGENMIYDRLPEVPVTVEETLIYDRPPKISMPVNENLLYDRPSEFHHVAYINSSSHGSSSSSVPSGSNDPAARAPVSAPPPLPRASTRVRGHIQPIPPVPPRPSKKWDTRP